MQITLQIANADDNLLKAIKSVINLHPHAKLKIKKSQEKPSNRLLEAIAEVEDMKQNPNFYKGYSSGKEVIEACLND